MRDFVQSLHEVMEAAPLTRRHVLPSRCPRCGGKVIEGLGVCERCRRSVPEKAKEKSTALSVSPDKIADMANDFIKQSSLFDLIKLLQRRELTEAVGKLTDIEVEIEKPGGLYNLYKITVPVDGINMTVYAVKESIPLKDEKPLDTINRIMDELKIISSKALEKYDELLKKGEKEEANKALAPELFKDPNEAQQRFNKLMQKRSKTTLAITKPQAKRLQAAAAEVSKSYRELVQKRGLLRGSQVAMALNIGSADKIPKFSANIITKIVAQFPQWAELLDHKDLTADEINAVFPNAKVTVDLVNFVADNSRIDTAKIDIFGAQALAAASAIASAAIVAADKKAGAEA